MEIPITKLYFNEKEEAAVKEVIRSGWIIQGKKTEEFEKRIASYVGAQYAIATSNCTTALKLSLLVSGIKAGDEVICPSFTFIATPNSIEHINAKPIFCDIDEDTYNLDAGLIEEKITEKTKAIMPVDQLGLPYDQDRITKIAEKNNLKIIEDAAPALGAENNNRKIGSISPLTCFSFHPRKIITTGEGGIITTDKREYFERLRGLRDHGTQITPLERLNKKVLVDNYPELGYNHRITDIQSAIGIEQIKKIDEILKKRITIARRYNEELDKIDNIKIPFVPSYAKHNYQTYIIEVQKISRDGLVQELLNKGIATKPGVDMCHSAGYYIKKYGKMVLPKTEKAHAKTLIIPIYPSMTQEEQEYVIKTLKDAVNKLK